MTQNTIAAKVTSDIKVTLTDDAAFNASLRPPSLVPRSLRTIAFIQLSCIIIAGFCFGAEFGWKVGLGVGCITWALSPIIK